MQHLIENPEGSLQIFYFFFPLIVQNPADESDNPSNGTAHPDTPSIDVGCEVSTNGPTHPDTPSNTNCETPPQESKIPAPKPKDYTPYPPLIGPPRAGDKIAYKVSSVFPNSNKTSPFSASVRKIE